MSSRLTQRLDFCFKEQSYINEKIAVRWWWWDNINCTRLRLRTSQGLWHRKRGKMRWEFLYHAKEFKSSGFLCQRWEVTFKSFCRWSTSRIDCSGWLLDCSHSILSAFRGCHFYCECRSSPFYVFTTLPSFIVMNRTSSSNYYFRDCPNNKEDVIGRGQFGCQDGQLFKEGIVCTYTM